MNDPFEILMAEHLIIGKVLTALEATASVETPVSFFERAADFIAQFADGCHHAKEEDALFPRLVERGIPLEMGPIGVMLEEHHSGRGHVKAMRELIAVGDVEALRCEALAYAALMRDHIAKEDEVLFPMGRGALGPEDHLEIAAAFDAISEASGGTAAYEALADELLREVSATA